jgi:hypothetical protein
MAKYANDSMMDAALNYLKNNVDKLVVCSQQPTTYTEANATYALADVAVDTNDFTLANGDTNGRKVTVGAQADVPIDASGTATHVAMISTGDTTLRYVTTCTSQALTSGGTVDLPAFDVEVADPS